MKSAPIAAPCIGWSCGGMPSDNLTDFPPASWPVTTRPACGAIRLLSRLTPGWHDRCAGCRRQRSRPSMPLEVLYVLLVVLARLLGAERAEVAALAGLRVLLLRVEAIFARGELADHAGETSRVDPRSDRGRTAVAKVPLAT